MDSNDARDRNARAQVATITAGIVVTGDVECAADLQIAGRVQGDVRCSTLFVDEGGAVIGGVYADRVRVSGRVDGTMEAGDLAIEPGGRVSGTISYARLKVGAGGIAEGSFQHRGTEGATGTAGTAAAAPDTGFRHVDAPEPVNPRRVYVD